MTTLKICSRLADNSTSFISLHKMCNRATPIEIMRYKTALYFLKLYNTDFNPIEFVNLIFNQVITGRQVNFKSFKDNSTRVGLNSLANRHYILNDVIPLAWFNMSLNTFKVHCKKLFLV